MPRKNKEPWLEYSGQTTQEILACKTTHRIDSLLCAIEEGIQAKDEHSVTEEERVVLAIMALEREVNNGGYDQFFLNSSRRFVPTIIESLRRIGCDDAAAITERAIGAQGQEEILDACDQEFYQLGEIEARLFAFIEAHEGRISLSSRRLPPRPVIRKASNASKLHIYLMVAKVTGNSLEEVRLAARELALKSGISATDAEIEGAAVLYLFSRAIRSGDLAGCELLAPRAFDLMRDDTWHCLVHRDWVQHLLQNARADRADAATLMYLEYLKSCDQSTLWTQNGILFWAKLLQEHRSELPRSVAFFQANFPHENLDRPLPAQRFRPGPAD